MPNATPIIGPHTVMPDQAHTALMRFVPPNTPNNVAVFGEYTAYDVLHVIVATTWDVADRAGLDFGVLLAQQWHETAERKEGDPRGYVPYSSWWAARPRRNPAGVGVTGRSQAVRRDAHGMAIMPASGEWALHPGENEWREGVSFESWKDESILAQAGRLLAYALAKGAGTPEQQRLISFALSFRPLPDRARGSAPTVRELGRVYNRSGLGWASPGVYYGARIEEIMRKIRG